MGSSFSSSVTRIYSDIFAGTHCGVQGGGRAISDHPQRPVALPVLPSRCLPPVFPTGRPRPPLSASAPPCPGPTGPGETSPRPGAGPSRRGRAEGSPRALQRPACRQPRSEGTRGDPRALAAAHRARRERRLREPCAAQRPAALRCRRTKWRPRPPSEAGPGRGANHPQHRGGDEEKERNSAAGARLAAGSATGPELRLRSAASETAAHEAGAAAAKGEGAAAGTAAPPPQGTGGTARAAPASRAGLREGAAAASQPPHSPHGGRATPLRRPPARPVRSCVSQAGRRQLGSVLRIR